VLRCLLLSVTIEDGEFDYKNTDTLSFRGARYFIIITDDYSRYRWFFVLKLKSDPLQIFIDWITKMRIQHNFTHKRIRTDKAENGLTTMRNSIQRI
jgi:hypothetical protein